MVSICATLAKNTNTKQLLEGSPHDSTIPLLGIYLDKTIIQKDLCTHMFVAALFTIKKQRYYFADKGPFSQSYGFSSSHVWM